MFNCSTTRATSQPLLYFLSFLQSGQAGVPQGQLTQNPDLGQGHHTLRLLTELRMLENVTVTDAMAEDMEKLRPRLKKVHIRELVLAIATMPKMHKPMFACRRKVFLRQQPWPLQAV